MAKTKKAVNPAARMIETKRKLIVRLNSEIRNVRKNAAADVQSIKFRIRQAQIVMGALEKGTLR